MFFSNLKGSDVDKINFEQKLKFVPKLVLLLKNYCIKGDYKVDASVFCFFFQFFTNKIDSKQKIFKTDVLKLFIWFYFQKIFLDVVYRTL